MDDWQEFIEAVPWFLNPASNVEILETTPGWTIPMFLVARFPRLAEILTAADVTRLMVDNTVLLLAAWDSTDGCRIGWLCLPPAVNELEGIYDEHARLLQSFGGIVERFNEPQDTWLLNQNDVLTAREATWDASFINDYKWAFDDAGCRLPIELTEYYSIAREANGNTTLCHRRHGDVLLFATDHSFDFVTPLEGCPEYTLYRFNGVMTFRDWVETLAGQWLSHIQPRQ